MGRTWILHSFSGRMYSWGQNLRKREGKSDSTSSIQKYLHYCPSYKLKFFQEHFIRISALVGSRLLLSSFLQNCFRGWTWWHQKHKLTELLEEQLHQQVAAGFLQQLICQQQKTSALSFYVRHVQEVFFENVGFYFDLRIFSE